MRAHAGVMEGLREKGVGIREHVGDSVSSDNQLSGGSGAAVTAQSLKR